MNTARKPDEAAMALVIDAANLGIACEEHTGDAMDILKLIENVQGTDAHVESVVACTARFPGDDGLVRDALKAAQLEVRERLVNRNADGSLHKSDCDADIGFALAEAGHQAATVVLFSGDADFAPVVRRLTDSGTAVVVVAFTASASRALQHAASRFIPAEQLLEQSAQSSATQAA